MRLHVVLPNGQHDAAILATRAAPAAPRVRERNTLRLECLNKGNSRCPESFPFV